MNIKGGSSYTIRNFFSGGIIKSRWLLMVLGRKREK